MRDEAEGKSGGWMNGRGRDVVRRLTGEVPGAQQMDQQVRKARGPYRRSLCHLNPPHCFVSISDRWITVVAISSLNTELVSDVRDSIKLRLAEEPSGLKTWVWMTMAACLLKISFRRRQTRLHQGDPLPSLFFRVDSRTFQNLCRLYQKTTPRNAIGKRETNR